MEKELIMLVDDAEVNRLVLRGILKNEYDIMESANGSEAIEMLMSGKLPSLVLLDILMPVVDGYEVIKFMKSHVHTLSIPIIVISGADSAEHERKTLMLGAADFIAKPFIPEAVRIRVSNHLRLKNYSETIEGLVEKRTLQLINTREKVLETMANLIEHRNIESGLHVKRTRNLTEILLNHVCKNPKYGFDISRNDQELFLKAVPLHDIGKIAIPDSILLKPTCLTEEEYEIIKTHAAIGSEIIRLLQDEKDGYLTCCYDVCRSHHERWDGTGYPDKLSGKDIPIPARFLSIVDVYDALVFSRIYKPPFSHKKAVEIITEGMNSQFDPMLVAAFLEVEKEFEKMMNSEGRL